MQTSIGLSVIFFYLFLGIDLSINPHLIAVIFNYCIQTVRINLSSRFRKTGCEFIKCLYCHDVILLGPRIDFCLFFHQYRMLYDTIHRVLWCNKGTHRLFFMKGSSHFQTCSFQLPAGKVKNQNRFIHNYLPSESTDTRSF